jgi:hypothetical protein
MIRKPSFRDQIEAHRRRYGWPERTNRPDEHPLCLIPMKRDLKGAPGQICGRAAWYRIKTIPTCLIHTINAINTSEFFGLLFPFDGYGSSEE